MSQSSDLSRSRLAILTLSGVAAAYGVYVIYRSIADQPNKHSLQRSNAIHRTRPPRPESPRIVSYLGPDENAPLGTLVVQSPITSRSTATNLIVGPIPLASTLEDLLGDLAQQTAFQHELYTKAVECVINAAATSTSPEYQAFLSRFRPGSPLFQSRTEEAMHQAAVEIGDMLGDIVTAAHVRDAIRNFLGSREPPIFLSQANYSTQAETDIEDEFNQESAAPAQGLKRLLYHIAETDAKRKAYVHRGIHCEECSESPIRGVRWHCLNCPDYDLCSTCEAYTAHPKTHVFAKITIPLPLVSQPTQELAVWYPGDPRKTHVPLSNETKKRLGTEYGFEDPQIDANYDQFCCIANVPWPDDPNRLMSAIDRRAFNKAMTSEKWRIRFRPNALHDRMFAFYDTNNDGLIGFEEFVSGLSYLRGPQRFAQLRRAIQGFDLDGDGYVNREDFLRLFRAKHELHKLMINDMVETQGKWNTLGAMDTLRSSQPISAAFNNEEIPSGRVRSPGNKREDAFGDLQPGEGAMTVLQDDEGWDEDEAFPNGNGGPAHEQLQHQLSRFEELLDGSTTATGTANGEQEGTASGSAPTLPHSNGGWFSDNHSHTQPDTPSAWNSGSVNSDGTDTSDDAADLDQDILWQAIDKGHNQILDQMFGNRERKDNATIRTRRERKRWRAEIDNFVADREALEDQISSDDEGLPLHTTPVDSAPSAQPSAFLTDEELLSQMVPTDTRSLELNEFQRSQDTLQALLQRAGYGVVGEDTHENDAAPGPAPEQDGSSTATSISNGQSAPSGATATHAATTPALTASAHDELHDPTLPQHRPNSISPQEAASSEDSVDAVRSTRNDSLNTTQPGPTQQGPAHDAPKKENPPSKRRLHLLACWDANEREIRARGGPGRLSYEEIEATVRTDPTREMRTRIISWLQWASF